MNHLYLFNKTKNLFLLQARTEMCSISIRWRKMETVRENGIHRVNGSTGSEVSGSPSKSANHLKIVESGVNSEKISDESSKAEMDPYKELELYLAKVNVSLFSFFIFYIWIRYLPWVIKWWLRKMVVNLGRHWCDQRWLIIRISLLSQGIIYLVIVVKQTEF